MIRLLPLVALALAGCTTPKTWQQACFQPAYNPNSPKGVEVLYRRPAQVFNPVLTTTQYNGRKVVLCDEG